MSSNNRIGVGCWSACVCVWLCLSFLQQGALAHADETAPLVLADFTKSRFAWVGDGFAQENRPDGIRLFDHADGWGTAGSGTGVMNLTTLAQHHLVVEVTPQLANRCDTLIVELVDAKDCKGKWTFHVPSLAGERRRVVSPAPLASPPMGIGDFRRLDLSRIVRWQVLGQYGSQEPFDMTLHRLATTSDVPAPYTGHKANAAWRAEAQQRIERHRKMSLAVRVVDEEGHPIEGAQVHVAMQRHAFGFGTAVQARRIVETSADSERYRQVLLNHFNMATLENSLKWPFWIGENGPKYGRQQTQTALDWLNASELTVRGHVLVWPGTENLPKSVNGLLRRTKTPSRDRNLQRAATQHVLEITSATRGKIAHWDVVNEPRTRRDLLDALDNPTATMASWFKLAKASVPEAKLYLNEYDLLASGGATNSHKQRILMETLKQLQAIGTPVDGVGLQSHFLADTLTGPAELWRVLDRFAELGLAIQITEFDFATNDEALQAAYTRDFLTAMFAHPAVTDVVQWGFWQGAHYRPEAALFREDWSLKPNGQAYRDLVYNQWWTEQQLSTDTAGRCAARVFKGDYEITVTHDGKSQTYPNRLNETARGLELRFDPS